MKKIIGIVLILLMTFACAAAEKPAVPDETFLRAKEAVILISYGDYDAAIQRLGMADAITKNALKSMIDKKCKEIYAESVQTELSVAWNDGKNWRIAVPFEAPDDRAVGSLVFTLSDVTQFTNIEFSRWGEVNDAYAVAADILWNVEYIPDFIIVGDW